MAEITSINPADLRAIENNLSVINSSLQVLNTGLGNVSADVKTVYKELGSLAGEFHNFVDQQFKANRLGQAETRIVNIRQELDKKFGHYDMVRRTTTGILQADDLGIVKKASISNAAEELMISTPNYWLAPCLVALAAWINDMPELAEKALREGIKRNDEKTSLFFALVCRRADRKYSCVKWAKRYLENQDEENLDRKTIIILDAYASGLLGADSEGIISSHISTWLERLSEKPGFVEQQTKQWSDAINLKRKPIGDMSYTYLKKYSKTWPVLQDIMECAQLHATMLDYFTKIFDAKVSSGHLKEQLDEILTSLVTNYDDEELPLRKEEKFEQYVIDYKGDERRAKKSMALEQTAFDTHKDFTELLTDAAMNPESSHSSISTQKFSIALTKEWIIDAYNDVVAKNRMKIPAEIEFNLDGYVDKSSDGSNEEDVIKRYNTEIDRQKSAAISSCVMTGFDKFCLYGGGVIAILGLLMAMSGSGFLGIVVLIIGVAMVINHFTRKKAVETRRQEIETQYEDKRRTGTQIIRAILAEIVDFRASFSAKDAESAKVIDYLEQISPEQYVRKLSETNRRIKVSG